LSFQKILQVLWDPLNSWFFRFFGIFAFHSFNLSHDSDETFGRFEGLDRGIYSEKILKKSPEIFFLLLSLLPISVFPSSQSSLLFCLPTISIYLSSASPHHLSHPTTSLFHPNKEHTLIFPPHELLSAVTLTHATETLQNFLCEQWFPRRCQSLTLNKEEAKNQYSQFSVRLQLKLVEVFDENNSQHKCPGWRTRSKIIFVADNLKFNVRFSSRKTLENCSFRMKSLWRIASCFYLCCVSKYSRMSHEVCIVLALKLVQRKAKVIMGKVLSEFLMR
jgi:hypothetical protein